MDPLTEALLARDVEHCNSRTDYLTIIHPYDPEDCHECARIADIIDGWEPGPDRDAAVRWVREGGAQPQGPARGQRH